MHTKDERIAELEREVALLKLELAAARTMFTTATYQAPLVARGIPMPTQSQPEGNFWNPQL